MKDEWKVYLNCPCREFPPMADPAPIMAAYEEARRRAGRETPPRQGFLRRVFAKPQALPAPEYFVPVLIASGEDSSLEGLEWMEDGPPEERRRRLLSQPVEDGGALLARMLGRHRAWAAENGFDWPGEAAMGPMEGGEAVGRFLGVSDFQGKTIPLALAEIPVKHPWEVFAWVPFGGWNECPRNEEQMAAAKYWFERYGAVPAVITRDVLEYDLPAPVPRNKALELAMEQYAFCPDIVDQGYESVGRLADTLAKSSKWYFWWD